MTMKALVDRLAALKPSDRWITQQYVSSKAILLILTSFRRSLQLVSSVMINYQKIYKAMLDVPPQSDVSVRYHGRLNMLFTLLLRRGLNSTFGP